MVLYKQQFLDDVDVENQYADDVDGATTMFDDLKLLYKLRISSFILPKGKNNN